MSEIYKRRKRLWVLLALVFSLFCFSCGKDSGSPEEQIDLSSFYTVFIDVPCGDATFIHFPDGTDVLIGCGNNDGAKQKVKDTLSLYGVDKIHVFVLTSVLDSQIGNAPFIINNYQVQKIFIPTVLDKSKFQTFDEIISLSNTKNIIVEEYSALKNFTGENSLFTFLFPKASIISDSAFNEFNLAKNPTDIQIKNISPTIYVEYNGVRMLLGGDADKFNEKQIIDYNAIGYYDNIVDGYGIILNEIDVFKMQNHGDQNSNSQEFLELLSPKNAIITANSNDNGSRPHTNALSRLLSVSPNCNLYRTDTVGNITIKIDSEGNYTINGQN